VGYAKEKKEERAPDPILNLRHARLRAEKVIERPLAEKNGKTYAPQVGINWKILDDKSGGANNGTRFWDNYSLVKSFEDPDKYVIRDDTRIGNLAAFMAHAFHDGADYFESDVEVVFEDLEGAEVIASVEPKRFKPGDPPTGSRTVSETLMLADAEKPPVATVAAKAEEPDVATDDPEWNDIPF
jgi:hypothetical protein